MCNYIYISVSFFRIFRKRKLEQTDIARPEVFNKKVQVKMPNKESFCQTGKLHLKIKIYFHPLKFSNLCYNLKRLVLVIIESTFSLLSNLYILLGCVKIKNNGNLCY